MNSPYSALNCIQNDDFDSGDDLIFQQTELKSEQDECQIHAQSSVLAWGNAVIQPSKHKQGQSGFCESCGKQYYNLKQHLVVHDPSRSKEFKCDFCEKEFLSKQGCKEHMKLHSASSSHTCTHCQKEFMSKAALNRHVKVKHLQTNEFKCDACGQFFNTRYLLSCHSKKHTKPHRCGFCDRGFAWKEVLRDHILTHTGEKPFVCSICDKGFRQKGTLRSHVRFVHEGQKNLTCEKCGHRAARKEDMKKHMRTHGVGLKLLSCDICGVALRSAFTLKRHMEIHSRHFSCEICKALFPTKLTLQKHLNIFKGRQPVTCDHCSRRFHHQETAKNHLLTHEKDNMLCQLISVPVVVQIDLYNDDGHLDKTTDNKDGQETETECSMEIEKQNIKNQGQLISAEIEKKTPNHVYCTGKSHSLSLGDYQCTLGTNNDISSMSSDGGFVEGDLNSTNGNAPGALKDIYQCCGTLSGEEQNFTYIGTTIEGKHKGLISDEVFSEKFEEQHCFPLGVTKESQFFNTSSSLRELSVQNAEQSFEDTDISRDCSQPFKKQIVGMFENDGWNLALGNMVGSSSYSSASELHNFQKQEMPAPPNENLTLSKAVEMNKPKSQARTICDTCGKAVINLTQHKALHFKESRYPCKICQLKFKTASHLYAHMASHPEELPIKCSQCLKRFRTQMQLTEHIATHTGEKRFVCTVCGKAYLRKRTLNVHSRSHTGVRPYECGICGKQFAHSSVKIDHERIHTGQKPHVCDVCGKGFTQRSSLRSHSMMHTNKQKFKCGVCVHVALRKSDLMKHMETHGDRKIFKCSMCSRSLTGQRSFSQHMSKHRKIFKACGICGKHFETKENFETHMESYKGKPPVSCGLCDKLFHSKALARRHVTNHAGTEKRKYLSCDLCKFRCQTASALREHKAKYAKLKSVICNICGKLFHSKEHIKRHSLTHRIQTEKNQT